MAQSWCFEVIQRMWQKPLPRPIRYVTNGLVKAWRVRKWNTVIGGE